jgi:excisionase family DNA binding protein
VTVDAFEHEILTIEEAARILRVGRSRAYEMAASGEMPGVIRIGRSLRVSRRRLAIWIDDQAVKNEALRLG